jgi:superfamily II DNA or RNA helicase
LPRAADNKLANRTLNNYINHLKIQEMTIKSLKSVLKFWQEIVFAIPTGFGLTALAKAVILGYTIDGWNIFLVCFFVPLLICLIDQFFGKVRLWQVSYLHFWE